MKKKQLIVFAAASLIFLLLGIYLIFFTKFFIVNSVEFEGSLTCADRENLVSSAEVTGSNFFLIQNQAIEKKLKEKFSCIKSVEIINKFPNRIFLKVKNRTPQAKVLIAGQVDYLVDKEGVLFSGGDASLKIYSDKKEKDFKKILSVLERTKFFGIDITEASATAESLLIQSMPQISFALDKDIEEQIASLQLILAKAKIDEETLEFIDLRFDKPVVRFAPKKK
ncbi:FtsQ-type POTRA domain-containing protein [Candidatus Daviesbacteria bacterium]|nr:FtsQ-type POTRA domain-containing protein [Candidatus Daviesbacteria bacterium]